MSDRLECAYRGIKFYHDSDKIERGTKIINHEYPNTSYRYSEEMGKFPSTFTVNAIVEGANNKDRLINALESTGTGLLTLPYDQEVKVKAGRYTIATNRDSYGIFKFSIPFYISEDEIVVTPSISSIGSVSDKTNFSIGFLLNKLESSWETPKTVDSLFQNAAGLSDEFRQIASKINKYNTVEKLLNNSIVNTIKNVKSGATAVYDSISTAWETILQISDPGYLESIFQDLLSFEFEDDDISNARPSSTAIRAITNNNNDLIITQTKLAALAGYSLIITQLDYETAQDLQDRLDIFEESFTTLINENTNQLAIDQSVRNSFLDLKQTVRSVLKERQQNLPKIKDLDTDLVSPSVFAYRFYGDLNNLDTILNLNKQKNNSAFDETVQMVFK